MATPNPTLARTREAYKYSSLSDDSAAPSGPQSGPSSPTWRRQRLLNLGQDRTSRDETRLLHSDRLHQTSYGSLPPSASRKRSIPKLNLRRGLASLQGISIPRISASEQSSPVRTSPVSFRDSSGFLRSRPVSAYDTFNFPKAAQGDGDTETDVQTNGIRVWYSSFTSIDWLHDAIKDSARQARLRRHKTLRGKFRRQIDRSIGWLIVTIVGFLTAVVAFMIVRGEQWLFDLKEGYCHDAWYKPKRFCCPITDEARPLRPVFLYSNEDGGCPAWRTWADKFGPVVDGSKWIVLESEAIEYVAYVIIAVSARFACATVLSTDLSCL